MLGHWRQGLSPQSQSRALPGAVSLCNDELDGLQPLHPGWESVNLPEVLPAPFHSLLTNLQGLHCPPNQAPIS